MEKSQKTIMVPFMDTLLPRILMKIYLQTQLNN